MNDGGLVNLIAGFYRLVLPVGFTGWFYWLVLLVGNRLRFEVGRIKRSQA